MVPTKLMRRTLLTLLVLVVSAAWSATAQTNTRLATGASPQNTSPEAPFRSAGQGAEQVRENCIKGRRTICGKILLVLPDGLVVESGYTNLMREPLTRSWLVPGTVTVSRAANAVESHEPGAICIGTVFLTDLPKSRGRKPQPYDYVIIEGYPAGEHTYRSVGTIQKTVRRFSAQLTKAVGVNLRLQTNSPAAAQQLR